MAACLGALASAWANQDPASDSGALTESAKPPANQASDAAPSVPPNTSDTTDSAEGADMPDPAPADTQAPAPIAESNLMARAALRGNIEAVSRLRDQMPRYYDRSDSDGGGRDKMRRDAWSEAAALALQNPVESKRATLFNMLVDADTDWASPVDQIVYQHYQTHWEQVPASQAYGESLLAYTVATGDIALLGHALALGALHGGTQATEYAGDALATALRLRRLDLLEMLVQAGASPMASTSKDLMPLELAIDTQRTQPDHQKESPDEEQNFRHASVEILLRALTPEQVRAANRPESTLITAAFDAHDPAMISRLVQAGFTLGQVPLNRLTAKLMEGDTDLQAMLASGLNAPDPKGENTDKHNSALAQALRDVIDQGDFAILDHLFILRRNDFVFNPADRWHLARLMNAVWIDAIESLIQHGEKMNDEMQQKVVDSMLPGAISYMLKTTGSAIEKFCLTHSESELPLVNAITYLDATQWQQLLDLGIAHLRACTDSADVPPLNTLAAALLGNPFSLVGERKFQIPERITQLRQAGMKEADFSMPGLRGLPGGFGDDPAMQNLISALGTPPQSDQPASGTPDPALAGTYRSEKQEAGPQLQLRTDGRFNWFVNDGAAKGLHAEGRWEAINGKVVLTSDAREPHVWFKITGQSQYADGPDVGQPLSVQIKGLDLMDGLRAQIDADESEVHPLLFKDQFEAVTELESKPQLVALWVPAMKNSRAFEVPIPDLPRLKSITITLVPVASALSMPGNTVAQINDADELRIGNELFKKSP